MPPELNIQKYLRTPENSLESLEKEYGVASKASIKYPNLVHCKYDQISSDKVKNDPLVVECRGIILDSTNNWNVVAYPFNRFFNYGETIAAEIDWKTAKVYSKLDGSLLYMWFYNGIWNVSTSGTPDASGEVGKENFIFSELFWKIIFNEYGLTSETKKLDKNCTYMFELTSPYNEVVVKHYAEYLTLIGKRNNETLKEIPLQGTAIEYFDTVLEYNFKDLNSVLNLVSSFNPIESEGVVVCDANFNRIKIKNEDYIKLHRLKSAWSTENIIEVIRSGEIAEVLSYLPEYTEELERIARIIKKFGEELEDSFCKVFQYRHDRKTFAEHALKERFPAGLFFLLDGYLKNDNTRIAKNFFDSMQVKRLSVMVESGLIEVMKVAGN